MKTSKRFADSDNQAHIRTAATFKLELNHNTFANYGELMLDGVA